MSGWCTTLVAGVADCYFAQGLPWLIPVMPHEASHYSFIHSFMQAGRERAHLHVRRSSENRNTSLDGQAMWGLLEGVMMSATVELQLLRHLIPS